MILGVHSSLSSEILGRQYEVKTHRDAIQRDTEIFGLNAAQIFTHGPRSYKPVKMDYKDMLLMSKDIYLVVHGSYFSSGIWKVNKENKDSADSRKIIGHITAQLNAAQKCGADALVVHLVMREPEEIAETMEIIKPIVKATNVKLLLEMISCKGKKGRLTYSKSAELNTLSDLIEGDDWWGFCVDVCHIWGSGVNNRSYENMLDWLKDVRNIKLFHLNGSRCDINSGRDEHTVPFAKDDKIWYNVEPEHSGVRAVAEYSVKFRIPIICEIHTADKNDVVFFIGKLKEMV
jgi:endonuclease IV